MSTWAYNWRYTAQPLDTVLSRGRKAPLHIVTHKTHPFVISAWPCSTPSKTTPCDVYIYFPSYLVKLAKFQAKFKRVCCSTSVECYIIFLYIVAGFPEVSEISMRRWSNSVACRCQQAWRTWIRHLVPNHPQDWTLWIRGELPWHVLVFVLNITRINILLCKSEYDPFFGVAGSRCANSPLNINLTFL